MLHKIQCRICIVVLAACAAVPALAQPAEPAHAMVPATQLEFTDIQPEGFEPGMKIAAIHGDPSLADQPYVLRLSFPDGYRFPPHYHPKAENLTVLSGTFLLAMGKKADESQLQSYAAGDFLYIPPEDPHFGGAKGETVIQLHGVGPFEVLLPKD